MNRILRVVNLTIGVLLLLAAAFTFWYVWRPLPQISGTLPLAVNQPARIVRDARGVPHIRAAGLEDALFLQGYVHAQDRLWQMDALRRLASGELSEVLGSAALEVDREARRLRMRRTAESHYATLSGEDRKVLSSYARGVNQFISTHGNKLPIEFTLLGYDPKPWSVVDSILIGLQMFRSLTGSWKDEILKLTLLGKGDAAKVNFLLPVRTGEEVQPGSNAWAISGKLTASGKPILANDTHLEWSFPSSWYAIHLQSPELNVAGFSLPGLPYVIIGHNERIAWGITNLHYDVQDLYAEKFDPQSGRYLFKGQLEQARQERDAIRIKDRAPAENAVWVTRHGPIFVDAGSARFSLRWAAAEEGTFQLPFLAIGQAKNWQQFTSALRRFPGPGSNFVYADVDGNIGYHAAGKLPVRKTYDGGVPADGSDGNSEWEGYIPFDELPASYNPPSGMLITANQNPFPDQYPYRVNGAFAPHYRSRQIQDILKSRGRWKPEEMLRVQTDVFSSFSQFLAREVYKAWQNKGRNNPSFAPAAEVLKNWDGQMRRGLSAPFLASLIFQHLRKAVADRAAPGQGASWESAIAPAVLEKLLRTRPRDWFEDFDQLLLRCLTAAIEEGQRLQGNNIAKWDYGQYTQFSLVHPVLSRMPYIGPYFRLGPQPMDGSSTTVKQTTRRLGPSMRFVADLSNWENSLANITTGQSGQPLSGHFRDQWDAYYKGRSFPMEFSKVLARKTLDVIPEK